MSLQSKAASVAHRVRSPRRSTSARVALGLVAPLARVAGVGGIGIAVLSLAGLSVSESSGLLGFVERRPVLRAAA